VKSIRSFERNPEMSISRENADEVAQSIISIFLSLPPKCHPITRDNGVMEWTILSGIFLFKLGDIFDYEVISIGYDLCYIYQFFLYNTTGMAYVVQA
jgi:hypothetical protein